MEVKPTDFDALAPRWVWLLSLIGAVVGCIEGAKQGDTWKVWILSAISHTASSALAALLTYRLLLAMDIDAKWHVVLVGIAGHMGTEALRKLGEFYSSRLQK